MVFDRLKRKKDFQKVLKEGQALKGDFLFMKFLANNLKRNRFGIIVSKKVSKKSVWRNKLKRRIKESIRKILTEVVIKNYYDIVLVARPGLEKKNFWEIKEILEKLLKKAHLF